MEVNLTYKQTDVGLIPREWGVQEMRRIGSLSKGRGLLKEDIKSAGAVPAIPYTALYTDFSEVVDYGQIKWFVDDIAGTILVGEPCVLIASSSNMEANTGKASALAGLMPVAIGREVIIFRTDQNAVFFSYLLGTAPYRKRTLVLARGTTIKHLYPATFADYRVAVPAPAEQLAVAEALSDVDALLAGLDRLIAKKRDIKQAVMQQLLTGQTRLPGFQGEWEISTIGSEFEVQLGKMLDFEKNIGEHKPYLGNKAVQWNRIDISDLPTMPMTRSDIDRYRLRNGDLLVCEGGEIGRAAIWTSEIDECYYQKALHRLRPLRGYHPQIMLSLLYLWSRQGAFATHVTQTSIAHLPRERLLDIPLPVPTFAEQAAIAQVLQDMDVELTALEARRDKTRALKQGMMQELLTGRTRLV